MSTKIGEALIDRGLLTPAQLESALRQQLICGGHLGTNLVELGFIDEVSLGKTLAKIHGVRWAPRELFVDVPDEILETVPIDLVRKRRVVPVGLEDRILHLAVIDPKNLANLSTSTGYRVQPYIAPEMRVLEAMERYYGIPRTPRHLRLSRMGANQRPKAVASKAASVGGGPGCGPSRGQRGRARESPSRQGLVRCSETDAAIRDLSQRLSEVETHGELGELVLGYLAQRMDRCILFEVDHAGARPVNWRGEGLEAGRLGEVAVPVSTESVFGLALDDRYFRGTVPTDLDAAEFFRALGIEAPGELLILPIYGARLEAVLYGDNGLGGNIDGSTDLYLDLMERIGICLGMLRLKRRLRAD